ncbi:MAG: PAS domain S-box protein [Actinomycetota bacterium]|nr:PAS domain S-box protein [Actinomycetota bacterium]
MAEARPHPRGAVLEAVAHAAEALLGAASWEDVVADVLAALGQAAVVSRAHLFQNAVAGGQRTAVLLAEWTAPGSKPREPAAELPGPFDTGFERWASSLARGTPIHGRVDAFPEPERRALEGHGLHSIAVVPVFAGKEWWGTLGFDDFDDSGEWSPGGLEALRAAAGVLGASVQRHRQDQALMETEERYRSLVELSPDAIAVHQHGVVVFANTAAARLLGARLPDELLGRSLLEFVHQDSRPGVLGRLQRLREGKSVPLVEERFVRLDGTPLDVEVAATPFTLHGESAVQVVVRDVTDRKVGERRLQAQREYLEALHQTALGLVRRLDLDDLLEAIVSRAGALVGTEHGWVYVVNEPEEAIEVQVGLGLFAGSVGFRLRRGEGLGGKVWETGETLCVKDYDTWDGRAPDWPTGMFHAGMGVPLTSGDKVIGVLGLVHVEPGATFTDDDVAVLSRFAELASLALDNARLYTSARTELTERRRAEEALGFQAHLLDIVENAVVATDGDDRITYWNAFAGRLFGRSAEEAIGRRFREVIPIPADLAVRVNTEAVAGDTWSGDFDVLRPDGTSFVASARVSPIREGDGERVGLIGVFMDVTERHRAEEALRVAFEREKDVSSRLLALDEMKNTFLEAVSHELRTPLAAILGLALTMERQGDHLPPDRSREMLERLSVNARKLDRLLSDLLDLDRLSRGIVEPRRRPTDVGELVEQVVAGLELAGDRAVEIEVQDPPVTAEVDGAKVERIVENLVANAARHTPDGLPIWVRARRDGDGVLITVEDSGPGAPEHLKEAVFEPFRQGPQSRSHSPGVGIGLSLVGRFAELHGGRAWADDRPGGGAAFHVWLPDRHPAEDEAP